MPMWLGAYSKHWISKYWLRSWKRTAMDGKFGR